MLVLLGISFSAQAELACGFSFAWGEWKREGDTFTWNGEWAKTANREGWTKDGSVYITSTGMVYLFVSGAQEDNAYRVAVFVPREDGTYGSVYTSSYVLKGSRLGFGIEEGMLKLPEPGLYEGIVMVAVSGDGQVLEHTFDVLYNKSINKAGDEYSVTPTKRYYNLKTDDVLNFEEGYLDNRSADRDHSIPKEGIRILVDDREKAVFTGLAGRREINVSFSMNRNMDFSQGIVATMTLTETATGTSFTSTQVVSYEQMQDAWSTGRENYASEKAWEERKFYWNIFFDLPERWQEGEYELKLEVDGAGEDTVHAVLQKEFDPTPYYEKYCPRLTQLWIYNDPNSEDHWNDDCTVYYSQQGYLHLVVKGVEPGENYYALFQYTTQEGETHTLHRILKPGDKGVYDNIMISSLKGTWENIQLTVVGGGKILNHTFKLITRTGVNTESPWGLVFGADEQMLQFYHWGDDRLTMKDYQTESGFFVPAPRPGLYCVEPAEFYSMYVHLAFNGEPEGEKLIIYLIRAEDAGKPPEECAIFWKGWTMNPPYSDISGDGSWLLIDKVYQKHEGVNFWGIPGDIPSGAYQLVVQMGDKTEKIDFTLQVIEKDMVLEEIRKATEGE